MIDVKLIDGTARTVRELFSGRKYDLDYYQREYTWSEANVTELIDDLAIMICPQERVHPLS